MNQYTISPRFRFVWLLLAGLVGLRGTAAPAADTNTTIAPIIQNGFKAWAKNGVILAFDAWQKGGLMEGGAKARAEVNYFRRLDRPLGNYSSYELIETKVIGQSSQIAYVAINFEHCAVFARFLLYRTNSAWVIQDMDFSPKPETIMPWFAFQEPAYSE